MDIKIQLLIVTNKENEDQWINIIDNIDNFSDYSAIHLMVPGLQNDILKKFSRLLYNKNFFINLYDTSLEKEINYLVRTDCDYYFVIYNPNYDLIKKLPISLKNYINKKGSTLALIKGGDSYNNMLVFSLLHKVLYGFGEQTIDEKICIHCQNHNAMHLVFNSIEEFLSESTT